MEYKDLRKLGREGLKEVRSQVVRLKKMGKTGKEIEELTGVHQNRASEIWTAYQREGEGSLERKSMGGSLGATWFSMTKNKRIFERQSRRKDRKILASQVRCGRWDERGGTSKNGSIRS